MFEKVIDRVARSSESIPVCPECGPIRRDVNLSGETRNLRVMCPHQEAEERAKREYEAKERQRADHVKATLDAYRRKAPPPDQYADASLKSVDERTCSLAGRRAASRYIETWLDRKAEGQGLTLSGDIGTGKTLVAVAIANTLARSGVSARFMTVTGLQARLKKWDDAADVMDDLKRAGLLVLDDFGQERVTEWSSAQLFDLLDGRYQAKAPTILTTNLGGQALRDHYIRSLTTGRDEMPVDQAALTVDRVLSRLRQRNVGVIFSGPDQRLGADHAWLTQED